MDNIWKEIMDTKSFDEFEEYLLDEYDFDLMECKYINMESKEITNTEFYFATDDIPLPWSIVEKLAVEWFDVRHYHIKASPLLYVLPEKLVYECELFWYKDGLTSDTHIMKQCDTRQEAIVLGIQKAFELLNNDKT